MDAWQHRAFVGRLINKKNKRDRWYGEGRFKMPDDDRAMIGEEDVLALGVDSHQFLSAVNIVAIRIAQVKEQLEVGRKTLSTPPIMGDWLESEAVKYVAAQIPILQEKLGAIAKGTNEDDIDGAVRGLVDLVVSALWPVYNIGYLADLLLEQQAEELRKTWEVDNPVSDRIGVHYSTVPHNPCNDPINCDCACGGCLTAKVQHYGEDKVKVEVISEGTTCFDCAKTTEHSHVVIS